MGQLRAAEAAGVECRHATSLYEFAVVQWEWLTCVFPNAEQFNSLHDALIAGWPGNASALGRNSIEDRGNVDYLRDTAIQAGLDAPFLHKEDIGWDGRRFLDLANHEIRTAFKLYPWEILLRDPFGTHIAFATTCWIEPARRLLLSGEGILALLWELFPDHPNLLPAFREPGRTGGPEICSGNLADMAVWAVVSLLLQLLCFGALRLYRHDASAALAGGDMAEAVLLASGSVSLGLLNAACLT